LEIAIQIQRSTSCENDCVESMLSVSVTIESHYTPIFCTESYSYFSLGLWGKVWIFATPRIASVSYRGAY